MNLISILVFKTRAFKLLFVINIFSKSEKDKKFLSQNVQFSIKIYLQTFYYAKYNEKELIIVLEEKLKHFLPHFRTFIRTPNHFYMKSLVSNNVHLHALMEVISIISIM